MCFNLCFHILTLPSAYSCNTPVIQHYAASFNRYFAVIYGIHGGGFNSGIQQRGSAAKYEVG